MEHNGLLNRNIYQFRIELFIMINFDNTNVKYFLCSVLILIKHAIFLSDFRFLNCNFLQTSHKTYN